MRLTTLTLTVYAAATLTAAIPAPVPVGETSLALLEDRGAMMSSIQETAAAAKQKTIDAANKAKEAAKSLKPTVKGVTGNKAQVVYACTGLSTVILYAICSGTTTNLDCRALQAVMIASFTAEFAVKCYECAKEREKKRLENANPGNELAVLPSGDHPAGGGSGSGGAAPACPGITINQITINNYIGVDSLPEAARNQRPVTPAVGLITAAPARLAIMPPPAAHVNNRAVESETEGVRRRHFQS